MLKDRILLLTHFEHVQQTLRAHAENSNIIIEDIESIDLNEDFIWIIDESVWLDYQHSKNLEEKPWNIVILSENDQDLKQNIIHISNLQFFQFVFKYPFILKYKNILVLDDDINQLRLIKTLLKNYGFAPYCILNAAHLKNALKKKPDLIILDLYGQDQNNIQICRELKDDYVYHDIPVIFLSASDRRQDIIDVLDSGANDFIKKPFFSEELLARIGVQLRILYIYDENLKFLNNQELLTKKLIDLLDQTRSQKEQIQMMNKMLKRKSVTDPLTQIYNRGYLFAVMQREIDVVKRYKKSLSAVMFDLDFFKNINDSYGHTVGDQVLKGFVEITKKRIRTSDMLARYGGEEFVLLFTGTDAHNAYKAAEDIRKLLENLSFKTKNDVKFKTTVSGGVTAYRENESMESFFNRLDEALYKAKQNGRNQIVLL